MLCNTHPVSVRIKCGCGLLTSNYTGRRGHRDPRQQRRLGVTKQNGRDFNPHIVDGLDRSHSESPGVSLLLGTINVVEYRIRDLSMNPTPAFPPWATRWPLFAEVWP
jgi:hypothetical protein